MFFRPKLIGLLFSATLVRAQNTLAPRPVRDSAYAARNLFRERRQKALQGGSFGLAGISGAVFTAINRQPALSGGILLVTSFFTVLDVRQLRRYSESREESIVRRYEEGWPLPADIRHRLKAKHFHALK
jgi:hypothetical protein